MTTPDLIPVTSSMLQAIGYDGVNVYVRFNNGKLYRYLDVPFASYETFKNSESVGKHLNAIIKPNYQAELVQE